MLDRRAFLGAAPPLALLSATWARDRAVSRARRDVAGWGIQLYTLRSVMARDADRTLAAIAGIGYREVELAGLYGLTAREMKAKLDGVGLAATSSHQSVADVRGDWSRVLDGARELGQRLVVVPSISPEERTPEGLRRLAEDFNRAGETARAAGLRFGYHNHDWEHRALADGTVPIDLLLERTDPAVVDWQMDIFWTVQGGADPERYLREPTGRITSVHVKDRTRDGRMADVGAGVIDFARLIPLAEELGLRHAFVEHDQPGDDPVASARRSFDHLRRILP
jgi:sugar phosphate isomerase/epimerase